MGNLLGLVGRAVAALEVIAVNLAALNNQLVQGVEEVVEQTTTTGPLGFAAVQAAGGTA